MPNLNEFLNSSAEDVVSLDANVEVIESMRPCSKCDIYVDSYQFNTQTTEMYWKCANGHETRLRFG